jgi:cyclin H
MSYHPRDIMTTALFLATKTENVHIQARDFAAKLASIPGLESTTPEDVLAPEYLLVQGLRFTFDVRHPHRALKGAYLELQMLWSLARGDEPPKSWAHKAKQLQAYLLERYSPPVALKNSIEKAYPAARDVLQRQAVLGDAYFLYSPSQIMMASLWLVDDKLVQHMIYSKLSVVADLPDGHQQRPSVDAIFDEIEACAAVLMQTKLDDTELKKEAKRVDRKLHYCRNPEKLDLIGLNRATKRDAAVGGDEELDEAKLKKRKLEREMGEREGDVFGPPLVKKEGG